MSIETVYAENDREGLAFDPPKAELPVKLFDRSDGSYFHPSPSSTADHCIEFWSNAVIPDEIITQTEDAYYNDRISEIEEDVNISLDDWANGWVDLNPPPKREKGVEAYNERYRQEREVYRLSILPEIQSRRPLAMGSYDSRQLVRAFQMAYRRPHGGKFPEESEKVLDHEIELFDETLTVREIELKYRMSRTQGFMLRMHADGSQDAVLQALRTTNALLGQISENLVHSRLEARERTKY